MGIILYLVAIFLSLVLYIPATIYALFKIGIKSGFKGINAYFFKKAMSVDQFGNVWAKALFNDILIKKGGYKFGDEDETVSSALGKNKLRGTFKRTGTLIAFILDFIDPNHCIKSIEEDEDVNSK